MSPKPFTEDQIAEIRENLHRYSRATPPLPWPDETVSSLLANLDELRERAHLLESELKATFEHVVLADQIVEEAINEAAGAILGFPNRHPGDRVAAVVEKLNGRDAAMEDARARIAELEAHLTTHIKWAREARRPWGTKPPHDVIEREFPPTDRLWEIAEPARIDTLPGTSVIKRMAEELAIRRAFSLHHNGVNLRCEMAEAALDRQRKVVEAARERRRIGKLRIASLEKAHAEGGDRVAAFASHQDDYFKSDAALDAAVDEMEAAEKEHSDGNDV